MRAYGSGHFERRTRKLKSGKLREFAFGYVYSEFPKENGDRRHFGSGRTKAEAEQKARAKAAAHDEQLRQARTQADRIPSLYAFFDEWVGQKRLATSSAKKYRTLRKHLCDFIPVDCEARLGDIAVDSITFLMLERCYLHYAKHHYGKSPANFRDLLSEIWERLLNRGYVAKNLAKTLPSAQRNFKRRRLGFKRSDVGMLYQNLSDPRLRTFAVLGSHGLRAGEILGSVFERIQGNVLTVCRQFAPVENPDPGGPSTVHALCSLKHEGRQRNIRLCDDEMKVILQSVELATPTRVWDAAERRWTVVTFLVPNSRGSGWCYNDFRLKWTKARTAAGLEVRPHDLRRWFASRAGSGELGLNPLAISEALGHADLSTTVQYQFAEDEEVEAVHEAASGWVKEMIQATRENI